MTSGDRIPVKRASPAMERCTLLTPSPRTVARLRNRDERGRTAEFPHQIPAAGWRDILLRVKDSIAKDRLSIIAAGVAFYTLLSVFPGIGALIAIYGLLFDPQQVGEQVANFGNVLPRQAMDLLVDQLRNLVSTQTGTLSAAAAGALLLTLWSASKGVKTLMEALNVAYKEVERRSFIKLNAVALLLTIGAIAGGVFAFAVLVALPAAVSFLGLGEPLASLLTYGGWPVLALTMILGLSVMYRFGPSRNDARWSWVSRGAVIATVLWLLGSALFSYYATHFGNYNKMYGSVGAVVTMLMWFLLTAYVVLIGAEINAEMERQTVKDTTTGKPKSMGQRGAYAADTVGPTPSRHKAIKRVSSPLARR